MERHRYTPRWMERRLLSLKQQLGEILSLNIKEELIAYQMKSSLTTYTHGNEFSSTMASAIICLATNQKFNFSKYIFESMVKHLDTRNKVLMYPRFVQVFLDKQVDGISKHNAIYVVPSHTKKVFRNMERIGKGFFGRDTSLFPTMRQDTIGDTISQTSYGTVSKHFNDPPLSRVNTLESGEDVLKLNELIELYTKLSKRVLILETTKTVQAQEISSLKKRVKRLEKKRSLGEKDASKQGRKIADIDDDKGITLVDKTTEDQKQKPKKIKRKDTKLPQTSSPKTNIADKVVNEEMDDSLERAATTTSSLEADQDSSNINKTQSKATLNEPSSIGTSSGSGPRCQETMRDTIAQTRSENVSKFSNDSLLAEVNTPQSDEDTLKLKELMKLCTNL
nr:hypothetical protein [Tanacetum cinerariifolium]